MMSDPLSAVQQLQSLVMTLAPSLCPQVLPRGAQYGLDLILSLCKTEEQRRTLLALVQSSKPDVTKASETQQQGEEETDHKETDRDYMEPHVIGAFDVKNRVFAVQKVQWMHERDAVVHEFARFMKVQLEDPLAAKQVVQYFLEINGHSPGQVTLAQQCFCAAFALQTLLRAFPKLPIAVNGKVVKMTQDSDVADIFASLLTPKAKKNKKTSTVKVQIMQMQEPALKGESKQQKSKKRKSVM